MASSRHQTSGFTLIEAVITLAIASALIALSGSALAAWAENQRVREASLRVGAAFSFARGAALASGNVHLVYFGRDAQGNALPAGTVVVHDDGRPGDPNQNCVINSGEDTELFYFASSVRYGTSAASGPVPSDTGSGSVTDGSTFETASSSAASWVLFLPNGLPVAVSSDCTQAAVGTGGGAVYVTNGVRDFATVLSPLGAVRLHRWSDAWTS